jgi:hypothetical protein
MTARSRRLRVASAALALQHGFAFLDMWGTPARSFGSEQRLGWRNNREARLLPPQLRCSGAAGGTRGVARCCHFEERLPDRLCFSMKAQTWLLTPLSPLSVCSPVSKAVVLDQPASGSYWALCDQHPLDNLDDISHSVTVWGAYLIQDRSEVSGNGIDGVIEPCSRL